MYKFWFVLQISKSGTAKNMLVKKYFVVTVVVIGIIMESLSSHPLLNVVLHYPNTHPVER